MAARVIALISKKGGVGKTTSAVNLAAAFVETGGRALLVDLDPQASASLSLGIRRGDLAPSAADLLLRRKTLADVIRPSSTPGLDLITGSVDLASLESELGFERSQEMRLAGQLRTSRLDDYGAVFIDCPPSFALLSRNAIAACHGYVIPTVPHFLAVEGIRSLVDSIDRLRHRCQSGGPLLGILPTMVDFRTRLAQETLGEIRAEFGGEVFAVSIRVNIRIAEAPGSGQTIFEYDPQATGAGAYRLAAEELMMRFEDLGLSTA